MSFNVIRKNKILTKLSEFTVDAASVKIKKIYNALDVFSGIQMLSG